jgi:hypothetical protein
MLKTAATSLRTRRFCQGRAVVPRFSQRIARRGRLWWDPPRPGSGRPLRDAAHRLRERGAVRMRDDPDEVWRCCESWPRVLVHKWNGREFAARHGALLPELYGRAGRFGRLPLDALPADFVVRPVRGAERRGVLVVAGGRDLLRGGPVDAASLRRPRRTPVVLEERVTREDGSPGLPLEAKCHVFGGTLGAIELLERVGTVAVARRYYTPGWEPFPEQIDAIVPELELRDPPAGTAEMVAAAESAGRALGTYIRMDFFATAGRCVFNEFSTVPRRGRDFSDYGNAHFGALWAEHCAEAV